MLTPNIVNFMALANELVTIHKASLNGMHFATIYDPGRPVLEGKENEGR